MKISEAIEQLKSTLAEYGDIELAGSEGVTVHECYEKTESGDTECNGVIAVI